jgi:hypothetical protein
MAINLVTPDRIGFYHYGWYSDINSNITNNWTGNNSQGRFYPSVQLMYPTSRVEIKQPSVKGTMDCRIVIARPQYYNNDASYNGQSIIECHAELEALAVNILSEFNRIARGSQYQAGINGAVTIDYLSDAHNENLALLDCSFQIWYLWECPTDVANIANLPVSFNDVPPLFTDLEKEQPYIGIAPTNIIAPKIDGAAMVNAKLTVIDNGTWLGDLPITYSYQWQRAGIDIIGETAIQYTTVLADLGLGIACLVTATNVTGSASAISNVIKIV